MKLIAPLVLAAGGVLVGAAVCEASPTCTATGFYRDTINLTAAMINPAANVSGDVDATGCHIGVYYGPGTNGNVQNAHIYGATYFGVVNNGANVSVQNSSISNIGDMSTNGEWSPDGNQHGIAIYYCGSGSLYAPSAACASSTAQGNIQANYIWNYQKGGIVVDGPFANSNVNQNTVIGQGPVNYIAQNGIQVSYGAAGNVTQNFVYGNSYTGSGQTASAGILLVGGACYGYGGPCYSGPATGNVPYTVNINVNNNIGTENDIGVWFSNLDANGNPAATPTQDQAQNNTLVNNSINNTTGNGPTQGYQAGITDMGDRDTIQNNSICGPGYGAAPPPNPAPPVMVIPIDASAATPTNNPTVQNNTVCATVDPPAVARSTLLKASPIQ